MPKSNYIYIAKEVLKELAEWSEDKWPQYNFVPNGTYMDCYTGNRFIGYLRADEKGIRAPLLDNYGGFAYVEWDNPNMMDKLKETMNNIIEEYVEFIRSR